MNIEHESYTVDVKEVWNHIVSVRLPKNATVEQICNEATEAIMNEAQENVEYDYTLPEDSWTVRDSSGNFLKA